MELERLDHELSVCRLASGGKLDINTNFFFAARTDGELSLVCRTEDAPANAEKREDGWRAFRIRGELDFSLTGILARISGVLAENGIGIFAVSTYNTDYILVKKERFEKALKALESVGYTVV